MILLLKILLIYLNKKGLISINGYNPFYFLTILLIPLANKVAHVFLDGCL